MKTYWDSFIDDYKQKLADLTLRQILEVFWVYAEKGKFEADKRLFEMKNKGKIKFDISSGTSNNVSICPTCGFAHDIGNPCPTVDI